MYVYPKKEYNLELLIKSVIDWCLFRAQDFKKKNKTQGIGIFSAKMRISIVACIIV